MNDEQKNDNDVEIARMMDHCDECESDETNCINSSSASQFSDAWYEMKCAKCGAVWTVYDRSE